MITVANKSGSPIAMPRWELCIVRVAIALEASCEQT
jgi:hypothetical protein